MSVFLWRSQCALYITAGLCYTALRMPKIAAMLQGLPVCPSACQLDFSNNYEWMKFRGGVVHARGGGDSIMLAIGSFFVNSQLQSRILCR